MNDAGIIKPRGNQEWRDRALSIGMQLHSFLGEHQVTEVVIEEPAAMGMVGRSTMSVGKLMFLEGIVSYITAMKEVFRYKVNTWKGSLPKHAVTMRVNKILGTNLNDKVGYDGMDTDIADAIGVGIYHLRKEYGSFSSDHYFGGRGRT